MRRTTSTVVVALASLAAIFAGTGEAVASEPAAGAPSRPAVVKPVEARPTGPIARASTEVTFADLPQGQVLDQDWNGRPAWLPAGGKIDGVTIKRVTQKYGKRQQVAFTVTDADVVRDGTVDGEEMNLNGRCLASANMDTRAERLARAKKNNEPLSPEDEEAQESERWAAGMNTQDSLQRYQQSDGVARNDRVQQLHIEELVPTAQGLALDSRDLWVDATTGGTRLRASAHLPLRDLGVSPVGVHLYAARTADQVVFVARQLKGASSVFAGRKDATIQPMSCGHIALRLDVKRGLSEMVTLQSLVKIEDEEAIRAAEAKAKTEDAPVDSQPFTRTRLARMTLSSTWEPADSGPLIAFSGAWADRPRND
jgi:hypothetical protein